MTSDLIIIKQSVKSNLESIAGSIQAYHDAVFVGTGKKCDRKRNRNTVTNNINKVKLKLVMLLGNSS